jgi:hypothetical protein
MSKELIDRGTYYEIKDYISIITRDKNGNVLSAIHCPYIPKGLEENQDLVYRLKRRAEIRRQISSRKSVQEGKPDRIADLLEEAATEIESLQRQVESLYCEQAGEDW